MPAGRPAAARRTASCGTPVPPREPRRPGGLHPGRGLPRRGRRGRPDLYRERLQVRAGGHRRPVILRLDGITIASGTNRYRELQQPATSAALHDVLHGNEVASVADVEVTTPATSRRTRGTERHRRDGERQDAGSRSTSPCTRCRRRCLHQSATPGETAAPSTIRTRSPSTGLGVPQTRSERYSGFSGGARTSPQVPAFPQLTSKQQACVPRRTPQRRQRAARSFAPSHRGTPTVLPRTRLQHAGPRPVRQSACGDDRSAARLRSYDQPASAVPCACPSSRSLSVPRGPDQHIDPTPTEAGYAGRDDRHGSTAPRFTGWQRIGPLSEDDRGAGTG